MKLMNSLREHLLANIEHLAKNPDRLIISVEKGQLVFFGQSLLHRQDYTATVEIDEWPDLEPNLILVPLLDWFMQQQDPIAQGEKNSPIRFETYVLSNHSTTLVISLDLQETVSASKNSNGQYDMDYCAVAL